MSKDNIKRVPKGFYTPRNSRRKHMLMAQYKCICYTRFVTAGYSSDGSTPKVLTSDVVLVAEVGEAIFSLPGVPPILVRHN